MNRATMSCGPLYRLVRRQFTDEDPIRNRAFAQGFMCGQAEKVYLGACPAAMFRPTTTVGQELLRGWAATICECYGLRWTVVNYLDPSRSNEDVLEVWIFRDAIVHVRLWELMRTTSVNTAEWHTVRGRLTGVQAHEIDEWFHERQSAGDLDGDLSCLPWHQRLWFRLCGYLHRQVEVATPAVLEETQDCDEPTSAPSAGRGR